MLVTDVVKFHLILVNIAISKFLCVDLLIALEIFRSSSGAQ